MKPYLHRCKTKRKGPSSSWIGLLPPFVASQGSWICFSAIQVNDWLTRRNCKPLSSDVSLPFRFQSSPELAYWLFFPFHFILSFQQVSLPVEIFNCHAVCLPFASSYFRRLWAFHSPPTLVEVVDVGSAFFNFAFPRSSGYASSFD